MITRFAFFEGTVADTERAAFREAVLSQILPKWQAFPGASAVRVSFCDERDEGAPEFPLVLAISYPDRAAMDGALASAVRAESRAATEDVMARYFTGRIHHHVAATDEHLV